MKQIRLVIIVVVAALFMTGAVQAQEDEPTFGSVTLRAGFRPDPFIATMISGGGEAASTRLSGCSGFIAETADYRVEYTRSDEGGIADILSFFFISDEDTTLLVQLPDETYACNDDSEGLDPVLDFTPPQEGVYTIWVGSYEANLLGYGYLMISEYERTAPGNIITIIPSFTTVYQPTPEAE